MVADSPTALVDEYLRQCREAKHQLWGMKPDDFEAGAKILDLEPAEQVDAAVATFAALADPRDYVARQGLGSLRARILSRKLPLSPERVVDLVEGVAAVPGQIYTEKSLVSTLERFAKESELPERARETLAAAVEAPGHGAEVERIRARVHVLVGAAVSCRLVAGEAWSDQALADLDAMDAASKERFEQLLVHAQEATASKPSRKWEKVARERLESVGRDTFTEVMRRWLPLVDKPRTEPDTRPEPWGTVRNHSLIAPHQDLLKGLAWTAGIGELAELCGTLTDLAISAYRKLPGHGARAPSVGNACVVALGRMPGVEGVASLARLKVRVRNRSLLKNIEKALAATAERVGVPAAELEEMAVPTFGLDDIGRMTETLGEYTAELLVVGSSSTQLTFRKEGGKTIKSVPAAVKRDHADEVKEIKAAAKEIQKLLPAQRERLDQLHLSRRTWDVATWRERYLDHPLVGSLARRLIWRFTAGGESVDAIHCDGALRDAVGVEVDVSPDAEVSLWHPIGLPVDQVMAWRELLFERRITQPFKQAHREVYLLTDAERDTRVYSNRFAAHILKQHQFHALCGVRGWKSSLRLAVDDEYDAPHLLLPKWGLRAEFWIESVHGDGSQMNDTGVYHYVATDQVRFYPIESETMHAHAGGGGYRSGGYGDAPEADPLPLDSIPPLVLSEVMRDVDLFVGVCSVGNDPAWVDGAQEGQRDYWHAYSFGELSATAASRRELLERLVPRLKIADRCSFGDRFLVVRGDLKTYRIHLGSGNILMDPGDRYLCIVPKSGAIASASGKVFLPFEGDRTLAVILSKAFLLAADRKITDESILSQIRS